jgi:type IV pilus assembly protein PilF
MRFLLILLASIFLAACTSVSKDNKERASLYLKIGTGHLAQGNYPQALTELLKAEQLDPKNPMVLNNLGLVYYLRGHLPKAETKFREAIQAEPRFSDAKNNLARTLMDQKRYPEALKLLHAVESDLTYQAPEKTFSNLGMAYFEQGQYKKAEDYLARSIEIRRQNCTTTHYYGRTLLELKRLKESAEALDQAVEYCRPNRFEEPLYFSAMSYFSLGEKEKSRARLDELLKEYPKSKFVGKAKGMLELLEQ